MRRRLRSNNSTILKLAMVGIVAMAGGFLLTSLMASKGETQALSATEFQPGRIIDDSIFYNPNTMTAAEIDAFIDSHNPTCDMWGTQKVYGNVTRAEYVKQLRASGNTKYHDPPFVCISEYYENPETHKTNFSTGGKKEEGMLSAGEIIYKAAQEYNINPQVLLVMLKKESYVWGDDWPHNFQYNTVMGYACPDGAPCDTKYYGFYNQVMMAAWQLNYYRDHIYSYNYRPYTTNNILYNPDRSCGSKSVYLENIATTSLYIYTPYVPNDAALANYPGTSWCGSYGNRNFYMYFREWFGGTLATRTKEIEKELDRHAELIAFGEAKNEITCTINKEEYYCNKRYDQGFIFYNNGSYKYLFGGSMSVWLNNSFLGYPTSNEIYISSGGAQKFKGGAITWTNNYGSKLIFGGIYQEWIKAGAESGNLGLAISSEDYSTAGYAIQKFEHGSIYYNLSTGKASTVGDRITDTWISLGMDKSFLGQPTTQMTCPSDGACLQKFKGGAITWTNNYGSKLIFGGIYQEWIKAGAESGNLGLAISSEDYSTAGYAIQKFEHGSIYYNLSTGKASTK